MIEDLLSEWHKHFGSALPDVIIRSPGRVNIIGEHTDYNEGYVMPGAMNRSVYIFISKNLSTQHHWVSFDLNEQLRFTHHDDVAGSAPLWSKYIQGALHVHESSHQGLNILFGGDLPIGAGVSSSSSLVCGLLFGLQSLEGKNQSREELAILGSRVEKEIIGLHGGIMDQYAIMIGQKNKVMVLDCRDRSYYHIPASIPGTQWVLLNTKVKHQLIESDYNSRADECRQAVKMLQIAFYRVKSLRDVTLDMLNISGLPELFRQRSRFVIEENLRVEDMVSALLAKDAVRAGRLLKESHHGLQTLYEVSCAELDHLAEIANSTEGVFGGRMMGGGFGGCVICLVKNGSMDVFLDKAKASYLQRFGFEPDVIHFSLSDGAEQIDQSQISSTIEMPSPAPP